jgi:hypothetical protein
MSDYIFIFINVFVSLIWFKTEAILEYSKYVPFLNKILKIKEFEDFRISNPEISDYQTFLLVEYNSFFIRLVTCPICFNVWLNIFSILLLDNIYNFFTNFVLSFIIYNLSCITLKFNKNE